ncbi:heterokaryon incompatibility protein-domain-containing protein [Cladorrhinum sp. PSN259]|nr:heterokaryon incompatibility protein-domain-containing protein [Cladorrhinum sp. PSN259]
MMELEFVYSHRLAPGEIRLLSLQPSPDPTAPLNFHLFSTPLNSPCPYVALSYVWGAPSYLIPITIDFQPFHITPNLHSALVHLIPELISLPIWVDAVCINQGDDVEKTAQIARMSQVYHNAAKVIAYLGPSDAATDLAVENMSRVGEQVYNCGAMLLTEEDMSRWPHFFHLADQPTERQRRLDIRAFLERMMDGEAGNETNPPKIPTYAAAALLRRPWFSRAWVIPEFVMAPDRDEGCVFAVGNKRIKWEYLWGSTLFLAAWFMKEIRDIQYPENEEEQLQMFKRYLWRIGSSQQGFSARAPQTMWVRKKYLQGDLSRSLRGLLMNLYTGDFAEPLGCSNPEDKIRALTSLADDGMDLDGILAPGSSWQDIYIAVARQFYRQGQLDFLSLCRQRQSELPSWVTDWRQHHRPPWLGYRTGDAAQLFDAGKGTLPQVHEAKSNNRILCLQGWLIDTIEEVGSEWTAALNEEFDWHSAVVRLHEIYWFVDKSRKYPSQKEQDDARYRIIVADKESNAASQQSRATEESREYHKRFVYAKTVLMSPEGLSSVGSWFPSYRNTLLSLWGSRPFLSSTGYVGICPGTAKAGDTIFIPSGSHCPYIIQRSGMVIDDSQTWTLLGEAYVHQIMDGELDLGKKMNESCQVCLV